MSPLRFEYNDPKVGPWTPTDFERLIANDLYQRLSEKPALLKHLQAILQPLEAPSERNMTSLRCLDWLVTNYSRDNFVCLRGSSVHESYKVR